MCTIAAWYFDWFRELRYPELRLYAKLWKHEYRDIPIKRIILYRFYTKYRKAFEQYKNFGEFKTHYTIVFELDCPAEDFNIDTVHDINTPCRKFIATTKSVAIDHPKHFEFIDCPFFTVYKRLPLVKDFRDEWYFEIIKYGEKPSHVLPDTIKKWALYPDCRFFTQQITSPNTSSGQSKL